MGTGRRERETDVIELEEDEQSLLDDEKEDGFELLDDDSGTAPEDRRRDPLRRPA